MFLKFQRRYPHKWSSAIDGDEAGTIKEWAEYLAGITGEQIKHGLEAWQEDWPPSAIEFKKACLDIKPKINEFGLDYVPEYYRERIRDKTKLLSSTERDERRKEVSTTHIPNLRAALKGKQ